MADCSKRNFMFRWRQIMISRAVVSYLLSAILVTVLRASFAWTNYPLLTVLTNQRRFLRGRQCLANGHQKNRHRQESRNPEGDLLPRLRRHVEYQQGWINGEHWLGKSSSPYPLSWRNIEQEAFLGPRETSGHDKGRNKDKRKVSHKFLSSSG